MNRTGLSFEDRIDRLRLARTPGIGPVSFARLIERFETAAAALDALPGLARQRAASRPDIPGRDIIEAELDGIESCGAHLLLLGEPAFPSALACIPAAPPAIIVKGRLDLLEMPACAMVGSRNASAAGLRFARELADGIGLAGISVVSGLARGIDGASHQGALRHGTIAVLAGGIDHVYPPEHRELHAAIAGDGLLVSEMPLGTTPTARDFPRRNRVISGLSLGILVVEAALRSGSLITARFAGEQGREVMAVPGSPIDPRARGTNQLLRDGAHLIESVDDVVELISAAPPPHPAIGVGETPATDIWPETSAGEETGAIAPPSRPEPEPACVEPGETLRALISPTPVSTDELARQAGLPVGTVQAELMELSMRGEAVILPGGLVQSA